MHANKNAKYKHVTSNVWKSKWPTVTYGISLHWEDSLICLRAKWVDEDRSREKDSQVQSSEHNKVKSDSNDFKDCMLTLMASDQIWPLHCPVLFGSDFEMWVSYTEFEPRTLIKVRRKYIMMLRLKNNTSKKVVWILSLLLLYFFLRFPRFIYVKVRVTEHQGDEQPLEARSIIQVSHVGGRAQVLGQSSAASPGHWQGAESEAEQPDTNQHSYEMMGSQGDGFPW